jgi:hypothetical protein
MNNKRTVCLLHCVSSDEEICDKCRQLDYDSYGYYCCLFKYRFPNEVKTPVRIFRCLQAEGLFNSTGWK